MSQPTYQNDQNDQNIQIRVNDVPVSSNVTTTVEPPKTFSYYWDHRCLVFFIFTIALLFVFGAIAGVAIRNECNGTKVVEFIWMFSHIILVSLIFSWAVQNPPNYGWDMNKGSRKMFYFYGFFFLLFAATILFLNRFVDSNCTSDIGWLIQTILAYLWLIGFGVTLLIYLLLKEMWNDQVVQVTVTRS